MKLLDQIIGSNVDIQKREFLFGSLKGVCYYAEGLVNSSEISSILRSFVLYSEEAGQGGIPLDKLYQSLVVNSSVETTEQFRDGIDGVLSGDTAVLLDGYDKLLLVATKGWETRSIEEPATESVIRGPRDGFTEDIRTNTAHLRRRIKDPNLQMDSMVIGEKTKTAVNIAYIKGTVKEGLADEVKSRLSSIKIDGILESGYIEELIEDAPLSPFTTIQSTERPDKGGLPFSSIPLPLSLLFQLTFGNNSRHPMIIIPSIGWALFSALYAISHF
jgi:spore germination protein KA